jgi:hypothetical protein
VLYTERMSAPPSSLTSRSTGCSAYFLACRRVQKKWPSVAVQTRKSATITTKKMICMVVASGICALPSEEAVEDGRDEIVVEGAEVLSYGTSRDESWADVHRIAGLTSWRAKERYHKPRPGGRRSAAEGKRIGEIDSKGREKVSSRAGARTYAYLLALLDPAARSEICAGYDAEKRKQAVFQGPPEAATEPGSRSVQVRCVMVAVIVKTER